MTRTVVFAREQLRDPFTLALLVAIPALFVISAAGVLSATSRACWAVPWPATPRWRSAPGWAAAFISGALGFFQAASSRGADRRLSLAGLGPARVASSRIAAGSPSSPPPPRSSLWSSASTSRTLSLIHI